MDKKRNVRVRISHQRLEALTLLCNNMLGEFVPGNDHHFLLREYLQELRLKLCHMARQPQLNYTLCMGTTEALAFYQLWNIMDISHDKYAAVIVETMLSKMSALAA